MMLLLLNMYLMLMIIKCIITFILKKYNIGKPVQQFAMMYLSWDHTVPNQQLADQAIILPYVISSWP